ncbi:membrane protein insertase YidC [Myroides ceti]|uniref:Membrane protein insertase YidC n=1 Tax=Paenimyroides ceti TaxID=395087 RepID=A0ABT8D5B9_9FLAO|nr:membrane protein insertase YidC [Paenimyroides ceti]MDN3707045.1 membrane protein insertase YidC [Paenimyroides ceti]MDN3710602.1 membrane protein insertase YidC [Paenimyroides ceti]
MGEKKLDKSSLIGMGVIAALLFWMMYSSKSTDTSKETEEKAKTETAATNKTSDIDHLVKNANDTAVNPQLKAALGAFAYSATLPSVKGKDVKVTNDLITITFSNKGGYIKEIEVNNVKRISKHSDELVKIIKDNNSKLNLQFQSKDNRVYNTNDLYFEPTLAKEGENQIVSMKLKTSETAYLEYRYVIKPKEYMLDFSIRTVGLSNIVDGSKTAELEWQLKAYRNEKSISYENRYVEIAYEHDSGKDDYLSATSKFEEKTISEVSYVAFKQHFFSSILLTDTPFKTTSLKSQNLVSDEKLDTVFTKDFNAKMPLEFKGGELSYNMNLYFGPSDYDILKGYKRNLEQTMPLGWGIFGWINKFLFIPVFGFLVKFIPHGIAIIVLTILVRLVMSPITYKSYVSQAKMKVIRPEVAEINEKFKNDPMKKQQETMKLYSKAGVNPMAGCIPGLLQIPIFYALFQFFPSAFDLRQKSFLWADDLSSYDNVLNLPFYIPFYGNHVSLFPILASIAIFFYMKMTTGDQAQMTTPQEGMPDMSKIMKIMIYISPLMMLFFFNNYASGLSLYYFISNLITIGIMYVIKNKIVKEDKIKAKIEENKTKERPKSKFQRKMEEMMEQAQQQKANQNKK